MRKITTEWTEGSKLELTLDATHITKSQPTLGIELSWNIPQRWWNPYVVIHLFHIHYQIGWLADEKE